MYYNQTYGSEGLTSKGDDSSNYDYYYGNTGNGGGQYNYNYANNNNQYSGYRGFGKGWKNLEKIPEWLELAQMTYEAATNFVTDSDCQAKSVCELVRHQSQFDSRALDHSIGLMDVAQYFNLPDEILNTIDEFQEAKRQATDNSADCQKQYPNCDTSLVPISEKYRSLRK